jgi:hypothetical protein
MCIVVLHSSQDHLRIGTHDFDHPISCRCKKHQQLVHQVGGFVASYSSRCSDGPSSSVTMTTDGECLACGGFSLGKPICLGNFEFIADYFGGLSLSPRRGNEGTIFMGSTHSGASTPRWAMIEDSTMEFLTVSSGEGSCSHPSPTRRSTGAPFAPTTAATWKENAPVTTRIPPWMVEPWLKTIHPSERHHAHYEGQPMQAHARHPTTELGMVS